MTARQIVGKEKADKGGGTKGVGQGEEDPFEKYNIHCINIKKILFYK